MIQNLIELQKLLSLSPPNSPKNRDSFEIDDLDLINFAAIYKKLEELIEKVSVLEQEIYSLRTDKNNEKYIYENERNTINEQLGFLQDSLSEMNKRLEQCNETIHTLELQNEALKEASSQNKSPMMNMGSSKDQQQIVLHLEGLLQKKKQKCKTLKKELIEKEIIIKTVNQKIRDFDSIASKESKFKENTKKSLGNSMSFEDNPNKNLLNTNEESDLFEEFSSDLPHLKDQAEIGRRLEQIRQKSKQNKQRFQKKLREFEHILRFIEKSLDVLIDNNLVNEEKDSFLQEILEKNENLKDWMMKLKGSLQMLATKTQRSLAGERDFSIKVAIFLQEALEIGDIEIKKAIETMQELPVQGLKQLNVHNFKGKITNLIEEYQKKEFFRTPKKDKNNKNNEALVFLKEIYGDLKGVIYLY